MFYGCDRPKFSILEGFFFFCFCFCFFFQFFPKSYKISRFFSKIYKFFLKIFENKSKYFPKIFLQNSHILKFLCFRVIFATRKKKYLTGRPYLVGPSVRKTSFCFRDLMDKNRILLFSMIYHKCSSFSHFDQ